MIKHAFKKTYAKLADCVFLLKFTTRRRLLIELLIH